MEQALKGFVGSLIKQRKVCPWAKKRSVEEQVAELEKEVKELKEAIKKQDVENMKEEFGDVLWDALFIGVIAEEKGFFTIKEALEEAHTKLKRRKPWVFGKESVASEQEAIKRWHEIKKQ